MKHLSLLLIASLSLFSCNKTYEGPSQATITKFGRWGIKIGSSFREVYGQLQAAGNKYNFNVMDLDGAPYDVPFSDIKDRIIYYGSLYLVKKDTIPTEAIYFVFHGDDITSISLIGGAQQGPTTQWPQDVASDLAIKKGDLVKDLPAKLDAILQLPEYKDQYNCRILPKILTKPFDPAMANFNQWFFTIYVSGANGSSTVYYVKLTFADGLLTKIYYQRTSGVIVN